MKLIFHITLFIFCFSFSGLAQQVPLTSPRVLKVASSKLGNYIYLAGRDEIEGKDTTLLQSTDHFIIKRMLYTLPTDSAKMKNPLRNLKTVGTAKKATTEKELSALFNESDLADIRKSLNQKTNKELLDFIATHVKANDYGFLYMIIEARIMLGQVYLDTDVKEGEVVYYQVVRVDKNKAEQPWGVAVAESKVGNYSLHYLKPKVSLVRSTDSTVNMVWKLKISDGQVYAKPKNRNTVDPEGNLKTIPFLPSSLAGRLVTTSDGKPGLTMRLIPNINKTLDTLTYAYSAVTVKDQQLTAYLMAEDEVYNQGIPSDTVITFGADGKNLPLVKAIDVKDIENAIRISWNKLPPKPYLTGVQVDRYDTQDKVETLAVLSATDTVYTDYAIKAGQTYRYHVKSLFVNGIGFKQELPAQGAGTYTKFSKPLPPYDLTTVSQGNHVALSWKAPTDPAFYGYYIYRGTSPKTMSLIAGPVKEKKYLDTAQSLSGRSQYYYSVVNQNLMQDTSLHSNVSMVRPIKLLGIEPPRDVKFYFVNGVLRVEWDDVRTMDNAIENFAVQRKKKTETEYTTLKVRPNSIFYLDSTIQRGVTYQYRVASIASTGEISAYSSASEYGLEKDKVATVELFYARNITAGVLVSVPQIVYNSRKFLTIYRRNVTGGEFEKIGSLTGDKFEFIDDKAVMGETYIYTMTVTETDDREGAKGLSLSVKRS